MGGTFRFHTIPDFYDFEMSELCVQSNALNRMPLMGALWLDASTHEKEACILFTVLLSFELLKST